LSHAEQIVYTTSEDGFILEGLVIQPSSTPSTAVVWIHGFTGKFYTPPIVGIGRHLAAAGFSYVTGNNRGHDFGTMLRRNNGEAALAGGGWEIFDESPRDVAAWIGVAAEHAERVVLLGHSLGGLKVVHYQATRQDPRVVGLVAASPPLRAGRIPPETVAMAEKMVAEGHGQDLLPWKLIPAGAGTMSAQTCLGWAGGKIDVYGNDTPEPAVAQVRCPILAFYGTNEEWVGGAPDLETIRRNATAAHVTTRLIGGADHSYGGYERDVAAAIIEWAQTL
jgi:pimeloyl-ACP methyl ester carboxylesterase